MKSVLLFSGGMDSVCLNTICQPDMRVYVNMHTRVCYNEYARIQKRGHAVTCVDMPNISQYELTNKILPGRNSIFVLLAAQYGSRIFVGATIGDTTRDKDEKWASIMTKLLRHSMTRGKCPVTVDPREYSVELPALKVTKGELLHKYLEIGGNVSDVLNSYSCYSGLDRECGTCRACVRKYIALRLNNLSTRYFEVNPYNSVCGLLQYSKEVRRHNKEITEIEDILKRGPA